MVVKASPTVVDEWPPTPAVDEAATVPEPVDAGDRCVVVGFDGRVHGRAAVRFAAEEAAMSGQPLVIYRAWPGGAARLPHPTQHVGSPPAAARPGGRGGLHVHRVWATGDPVHGLVGLSRRASLLVLGGPADGGTNGRIALGAGTRRAVLTARCTTVVVPSSVVVPASRYGWLGRGDRVVVGLDGSAPSFTAFELAYRYASRHRLDLLVLHSRYAEPDERPVAGAEQAADLATLTDLVVDYWRDDAADIRLTVEHSADPPGPALLAAARSAQLLVVAARSASPRLAGLGSVAGHLLDRARCPVALVRG